MNKDIDFSKFDKALEDLKKAVIKSVKDRKAVEGYLDEITELIQSK